MTHFDALPFVLGLIWYIGYFTHNPTPSGIRNRMAGFKGDEEAVNGDGEVQWATQGR